MGGLVGNQGFTASLQNAPGLRISKNVAASLVWSRIWPGRRRIPFRHRCARPHILEAASCSWLPPNSQAYSCVYVGQFTWMRRGSGVSSLSSSAMTILMAMSSSMPTYWFTLVVIQGRNIATSTLRMSTFVEKLSGNVSCANLWSTKSECTYTSPCR